MLVQQPGVPFVVALALAQVISQGGTPAGPHAPRAPVAAPPATRVLVPAYFYPLPGSPWGRLTAAAAAHPGRVAAIGNPSDGPGVAIDPGYVPVFQSFRASGGFLLGYVFTQYGARPIAAVKSDVDRWFAWYGVDGIFLDEMDNVPGAHELYYREITQHVRSHLAGATVLGNPGTSTAPSYLVLGGQETVSAVCIHEDDTGGLTWTADAWVHGFDRRRFSALPYALSSAQWLAAIDHAYAQNCGWIYATDDVLPNPWDTLPPWFETMVAHVATAY